MPALVELERRFFVPAGLTYSAVDLSAFHGVPSVLGVVRAPSGFPGALGVGAGTAPTVERAWFKALAEAFAARSAGAKLALLEPRAYGPQGEGVGTFEDHIRYYAGERTLQEMDERGQVVLRYAPGENFNGSLLDIAGVCNEAGNVFGLMPHPEHAVRELTGASTDGLLIFESMRAAVGSVVA